MKSGKVALTFQCANDLTVQRKPLCQSVLVHGNNILKKILKNVEF